jgi:4-hydroxy-3-methylbut-2-enyl diphosphate reductase
MQMKIHLARHFGMCFGVRDALRKTHAAAAAGPVTVLGQLVHNPLVSLHLATLGVREGRLEEVGRAGTREVVITAHGAADVHRRGWREAGHVVTDTTCPLVRKAHGALARLVENGYFPVVIGKRDHVEVRGLTGDFPGAVVIEGPDDFELLPEKCPLGVVAQTTQPLERVERVVGQIRRSRPGVEVRFVDTVCQPTKDRQQALDDLCRECEVVVVVGGRNSNNTRELAARVESLGGRAFHVERPEDIDPRWFDGVEHAGVTAGTSTLDETVEAVVNRLRLIAATAARQPAPWI